MAAIPIALQLYTLRNEMAEDFSGTLKKVADLGYMGIELAGTGGLTSHELHGLVEGLGLEFAGSHVSLDQLENSLEAAIEYNLELENRFIVCPYLPEERRRNEEDYRRLAGRLNEIGQECD